MSTSYEEAVAAVMKVRRCGEDEAALIVAENYGQVAAIEDDDEVVSELFDDPDDADVWLRDHGTQRTIPAVPIDEERSAAGEIMAQANRMEAERTGDYYRSLSKRTSMHLGEG